ncbi:DNA-binding protein [Pseudodesulfovibrio cashew]|uniref:DNA-binding protein n=1 Tax=Pseudodesulfovibrio cashew TaxID=2678688 RepID=A0A6I6JHS7_9BACT|nr:helix-turn-helix domain-containing protein [Pseudodesulfovibrio cashew]QGY39657.1 DNA-binding protein [Pseudodesulfovibrio cashew]
MNDFCLKGAREICDAVGENPKNIHDLVKEHGLPAWKRGAKGTWRALPDDLRRWIREQRDRNIGHFVYGSGCDEDRLAGRDEL